MNLPLIKKCRLKIIEIASETGRDNYENYMVSEFA